MTEEAIGRTPLWREHLGVVVSAITAVLVIWRVLAVAHYDLTTATALLSVAGSGNVALGGFLSSLPVILLFCACFFWPWISRWARGGIRSNWLRLVPLVVLALLELALLPTISVVILVGGVALLWGMLWLLVVILEHRRLPKDGAQSDEAPGEVYVPSPNMYRLTVLTALFSLWTMLTPTASWMPTESLRVDGAPAFAGYVVGAQGDDVALLPLETAMIFVSSDSYSRQLCEEDTSRWARPVTRFFGHSEYPACPSLARYEKQ